MRDLVRARAHLLQAGWPADHPLVAGLRALRDEYVADVGLATYLSQMLGEQATMPMRKCILGWEWEEGRVQDSFNEPGRQVQRYLRAWYGNDLPYVVEINEGGKVCVKYL